MDRIGPALVMLALAALLLVLLYLGWRSRLRRQENLGLLPQATDLGQASRVVEGQYVTTTTEGDWLNRVAVQHLGVRSKATLEVHPSGVVILRPGLPELFIPGHQLREVRLSPGMAGKFIGKDSILIMAWDLDGTILDTGFLPRYSAERETLRSDLTALAHPA